MTDQLVRTFEQLENASGTNEREAILKEAHPLVVSGFVFAMDPVLNYFIHRIPGIKSLPDGHPLIMADHEYLPILYRLLQWSADGDMRGATQEEAFRNVLGRTSPLQLKWSLRIIERNLRCGVGWGTFSKIHRGLLHGFRSQLCDTYGWQQLKGEWVAEPKLDGMRCYMLFSLGGTCEVFSRNGKPVPGGEALAAKIAPVKSFEGYVLDGELVNPKNRHLSIGQARRASGDRTGLVFHAFDMVTLSSWQKSEATSLRGRRIRLREHVDHLLAIDSSYGNLIQVVAGQRLVDPESSDVIRAMRTYRDQGYEGAVMKDLSSGYKFERSSQWLKVKPVETGDYRLVDVQRGQGRLANTCGRLIVDVDGVRVGVGTGLSDGDRRRFWADRDTLLDNRTIIEVGHEGKTPDGSLNFPRFIQVRTDK